MPPTATLNLKMAIHNESDLQNLLIEAFFKEDQIEPSPDDRFVYYTDADTAMKIIRKREVWLRNALVMNDALEVRYGLLHIKKALFANDGPSDVLAAAEAVVGSPIQWPLDFHLERSDPFWQLETYLACLSKHEKGEDKTGRLSMWRAYGDVAIVINSTPFAAPPGGPNHPYSVPVIYLKESDYVDRLSNVAQTLHNHATDLKAIGIGQEGMIRAFIGLAYNAAIRTKHRGFSEEGEVRVVFHPSATSIPHMKPKQVVIKGVAQTIWALQLVNDPANGLVGAALPSLLERIIIGPTDQPCVSHKAFVECLKMEGVPGADEKVVVSDIPLRK